MAKARSSTKNKENPYKGCISFQVDGIEAATEEQIRRAIVGNVMKQVQKAADAGEYDMMGYRFNV